MKRILLVTAILMANVLSMSAAKKTVIDRIEPTDWYVGMKNPQVLRKRYPRCCKCYNRLPWRGYR